MNNIKELIQNYSNQVWNNKNLDVVDQLFTEKSNIHSPMETLQGAQAMKEIISVWLTAFPDLCVEHKAFIIEGDTVVSRWKATGTHLGPFRGTEATETPVSYVGVSIYRLANEKITDYWAYVNLHQITEQLEAEAPALRG